MMSEFAQSGVPAPGTMHVDFEERVDFDRLRTHRLARAREALRSSELGVLLCFDMNNIRYLTSTNIGEWARDKLMRFAVLAGDADPVLWDFGSAAKAHRLHSPWLRPEDSRAGMTGLRGSIAPDAGFFARAAREVKGVMDDAGVGDMPLGVDISEIPMMGALADLGVDVRDGQQTMLDARQIKSRDEIMLLSTAAAIEANLAANPKADGSMTALIAEAPLQDLTSGQTKAGSLLEAFPATYSRAFGALTTTGGSSVIAAPWLT